MSEQEIRDAKVANGRIDEAIATLRELRDSLSPADLLALGAILMSRGFGKIVTYPGDEYPDDGEYELGGE